MRVEEFILRPSFSRALTFIRMSSEVYKLLAIRNKWHNKNLQD